MIALPNILVFQVILPFLAPLADLILVLSLLAASLGIIQSDINNIILYYFIFTLVDVAGAALAFAFEKEDYKRISVDDTAAAGLPPTDVLYPL